MSKKITTIVILVSGIQIIMLVSCKHAVVSPQTSDLLFPKVRTIVNENCVACHSPGGQGMPVFLDSDSAIVQNAALIKAATCDPVSPRNRRMPPDGQLSDADTTVISQWFADGGTLNNAGINK